MIIVSTFFDIFGFYDISTFRIKSDDAKLVNSDDYRSDLYNWYGDKNRKKFNIENIQSRRKTLYIFLRIFLAFLQP